METPPCGKNETETILFVVEHYRILAACQQEACHVTTPVPRAGPQLLLHVVTSAPRLPGFTAVLA